uniref:Organic cation transporter protein n=1 Tax=Lygus hesperus TaxID=30085 RepID=A0A0A9WLI7_LYGHE
MAYDDVLISLGQFGRYQKRINLLLCLPAISCALHKLAGVFLQARVPHRCAREGEDANATFFDRTDEAVCNLTSIYGNETVQHCAKWLYNTDQYASTTTSEFDLVCDRAWLRATGDALLMVGVMLGSIVFGHLSDSLGRKPVFFVSLVLQVVFGFITAIVPNVWGFMISRMIVGATTSGVFLVAYVIGLEMVGPSKRILCGVVFQLFFTAGFILTAGFAYFIRDWRTLQIAITIPGIAFFCYWWFIPESVRWQLTKGRTEQAKKTLRAVAKETGKKWLKRCWSNSVSRQKPKGRRLANSQLQFWSYSNFLTSLRNPS